MLIKVKVKAKADRLPIQLAPLIVVAVFFFVFSH